MGQSPHPVFCRKTTWLPRGKLGQVIWEEQGDCWDHPGQERQRKAAKRGKQEGKGGELGSRTDRDMQPYWDGGRVGEGQEETEARAWAWVSGAWNTIHFQEELVEMAWPRGKNDPGRPTGTYSPTTVLRAPALCFSQHLPLHSCSRVPPDKGPADLTV